MYSKTRSKRRSEDPEQIAKFYCNKQKDPMGFVKLRIDDNIGYGIFTTKTFLPGEFLMEYSGELLSFEEGQKRYGSYKEKDGCFLFFYKDSCVDATHSTRLGKYVNDSSVGKNCIMKSVYDDNHVMHLCLFALCDVPIKAGTELRYCYGDKKNLFWRKNKETAYPFYSNYNTFLKKHIVVKNPNNSSKKKNKNTIKATLMLKELKAAFEDTGSEVSSKSIADEESFDKVAMPPSTLQISSQKATEAQHHNEVDMPPTNSQPSTPKTPYNQFLNEVDILPSTLKVSSKSIADEESFDKVAMPKSNLQVSSGKATYDQSLNEVKTPPTSSQQNKKSGVDNVVEDENGQIPSQVPILNDSGLQIDNSMQVFDTSDDDSLYEEMYQDLCSPKSVIDAEEEEILLEKKVMPEESSTSHRPELDDYNNAGSDTERCQNGLAIINCDSLLAGSAESISSPNISFQDAPNINLAQVCTPSSNSLISSSNISENHCPDVKQPQTGIPSSISQTENHLSEEKQPQIDMPSPSLNTTGGSKTNEKDDDNSGQKSKKKPYKKPYRMCPFCDKMCSKLTNHISNAHKNVDTVKKILKMDKIARVRNFRNLKRSGIVKFNKTEALKDDPIFQGEKKRTTTQNMVLCSICSAFVSRRFFSSHRKRCSLKLDAPAIPIPMFEHSLLGTSSNLSEEFITKVVSKIRSDELGNFVRRDEFILYLGYKHYNKNKHKTSKIETVRKTARAEMRLLANLYITSKSRQGFVNKNESIIDLFCRDNFHSLTAAVQELSEGDGEMKAGLRQTSYYLIIKSCKRLRDRFFIEKKEELSREIGSFLQAVKSCEDVFLSSAQYLLEMARLRKTRKPCQLPLERDIKKLHGYVISRIEKLANEFTLWTPSTFVELRNLTIVRLTLLNARRGGEVGRLLISEWEEAKNDGWIDNQRLSQLTEEQKLLVKSLKIAFLSGKGNRHIVSLIIPNDTVEAMNYLSKVDIRESSGIAKDNDFLFASTQLSDVQFSGWHALKFVCEKVCMEKPNLVTWTNNRHRVSTLYAGLDISESDRDLFYKHMGHSAQMNRDVYQAPLALSSITSVGKRLLGMEVDTDQQHSCEEHNQIHNRNVQEKEKNSSKIALRLKKPMHVLKRIKPIDDSDTENDHDEEYNETNSSSSESNGEEIENGNCDFATASDNAENTNKIKSNVSWTAQRHSIFMERFGSYVRKEESYPFPSRADMELLAKQLGKGFTSFKIRTKINNERKKLETRTNKRLDKLFDQ